MCWTDGLRRRPRSRSCAVVAAATAPTCIGGPPTRAIAGTTWWLCVVFVLVSLTPSRRRRARDLIDDSWVEFVEYSLAPSDWPALEVLAVVGPAGALAGSGFDVGPPCFPSKIHFLDFRLSPSRCISHCVDIELGISNSTINRNELDSPTEQSACHANSSFTSRSC